MIKSIYRLFILIVLLVAFPSGYFSHSCLCYRLRTDQHKKLPIEDQLYSLVSFEGETGVFIYCSTPCRHGQMLRFMIFPDEGVFQGWLP